MFAYITKIVSFVFEGRCTKYHNYSGLMEVSEIQVVAAAVLAVVVTVVVSVLRLVGWRTIL